jgi:hypothetical protein
MGKTLAICLLTVTALILAGVVAQMGPSHEAKAQAGRFADYIMVPAETSGGIDALCIIDTTTQRMLFFQYDNTAKELTPLRGSQADLKKDFERSVE